VHYWVPEDDKKCCGNDDYSEKVRELYIKEDHKDLLG
jgi:hypothetical protein